MGSASLPELGFILKNPSPGQRRRSVSDAVLAVSLTECFFTTHTPCRQSWRGHRIATLNPGVGTGLPHSILAWAQDCHTQSWRGHRIAPVFPRKRWKRSAVQHYAPRLAARIARKTPAVRRYTPMHSRTRRPDCPENSGSALLYSRTLTENSASVLLCSSALTDSPPFPASNLASNAKEMGKIKLFPTTEYSSKQASDPVVPLVPCTGIFLGPSKSGKTVALISLILEQYRGVFERIYVFSPSVNIDDGWIPVKKYIEGTWG